MHCPDLILGISVVFAGIHFLVEMAPKKTDGYSSPKSGDEQTVANPNIACGSEQDPLVEQIVQQMSPEEMTHNQLADHIIEVDDTITSLEKQLKDLKLKKAELKKLHSEKNKPHKEVENKLKAQARAQDKKEKGKEDRERVITLTVRTNLADDKDKSKGKEVVVKIKQGATAGQLKDKILEQLGKRAPKGKADILFIKKGTKEIYNFGPQKCGLRHLHTLGVSDGDALDFSYGFDQLPPVITEADTLAVNIGGQQSNPETNEDINEEEEEETDAESDMAVDDDNEL